MIDVLVVDDDIRVAGVNTAHVAKVAGFRVVAQAHSAAEALTVVARRPVDLVLIGHRLPGGGGLAVVRELRRLGHETDVIMVTAASDAGPVQASARHGTLQYLVEPFDFAGLRAKLEAYATPRRTREAIGGTEQAEVDRMFGALSASLPLTLPKGHSPTTAELVRQVLLDADGALCAQEIAESAGMSRQTAQRYLKLLERAGQVRLSLRYGETGRPEHRYVWAASLRR
jgi:two-component system CitB family response regulator